MAKNKTVLIHVSPGMAAGLCRIGLAKLAMIGKTGPACKPRAKKQAQPPAEADHHHGNKDG